MIVVKRDQYHLEICNEDRDFHVNAKWDGCCDILRYYSGYSYGDEFVPDDEVDHIHICDLREFIDFLSKIADEAEAEGFDGYGKRD